MRAMAAIPNAIREERIGQGKLLQRVERVFRQMLKLHGRAGQVELFLFHDDVPKAMLWRECVLVISDGLADPLYDEELAGIISHELGHSYFVDEMAAAQQTRDARTMRLVELKCDAVAILSLKLMGYKPTSYLKGLQRAQIINKRMSLTSLSRSTFRSHPDEVERAQFAQRFIDSWS
jgi:predicted Zn-dependent protease